MKDNAGTAVRPSYREHNTVCVCSFSEFFRVIISIIISIIDMIAYIKTGFTYILHYIIIFLIVMILL